MNEDPSAHRSFGGWMGPGLSYAFTRPGGKFRMVAAIVVLILVVAVASHLWSRKLASADLEGRDAAIQQLRTEGQKREADLIDRTAQVAALQAKLSSVQAALDAITPSENKYNLQPNSSITIADGRLTIGLIGPPTNAGIIVNINGKQRSLAVGDIVHIAPDSSTNCRIGVQSFDMFKAALTASCAIAMPQ